jgi:hypothetical protein
MVSMERLFEEFLFGAVSRAFGGVTKQSRRDGWGVCHHRLFHRIAT